MGPQLVRVLFWPKEYGVILARRDSVRTRVVVLKSAFVRIDTLPKRVKLLPSPTYVLVGRADTMSFRICLLGLGLEGSMG